MRNVLLAFPSVVVTLGLAIIAGMEMAGSHPLTVGPPRSVSEAIALGDGAAAMRLLSDGADVNEIGMIRRGVLGDRAVLATPLEAAVIVDETVALDFLASRGADPSREHLACLASDVGALAVRSRLSSAERCRPGAAWDAVLRRP